MCVSIVKSKRERLESIKNMSDSYVEKTKIEMDILRNQQKNSLSLIQNLSRKIESLQKKVSQFEGQPLQMKYQEKLDELVESINQWRNDWSYHIQTVLRPNIKTNVKIYRKLCQVLAAALIIKVVQIMELKYG